MAEIIERERVLLAEAQVAAWKARADLLAYCERIEIAGSVRRRRPLVKDVELVSIPKTYRTNLLGEPVSDSLTDHLAAAVHDSASPWRRRPNKDGTTTFGPLNKLLTYQGFPVDVFTTDARHWGMTMFVRTGPAEWNIRAMQAFRALGLEGHAYGGVTWQDHSGEGWEIDCSAEETVFGALRWSYVRPADRL